MYRYLNMNPYDKKTGDCVIRATALGLGVSWYEASDMLYDQARLCGCEMSCVGCYSKLFDRLNLRKQNAHGRTVQQIADEYDKDTILIRIEGHLTCAIRGEINDIWDCTNEKADFFWRV